MMPETRTPLQKLESCLEILKCHNKKIHLATPIYLLTKSIEEMREERKQRIMKMIVDGTSLKSKGL